MTQNPREIHCRCGRQFTAADWATTALCWCGEEHHFPPQICNPRAPAGQTGRIPAGEAAQAEVRKLAERVTVLEGRLDKLCRVLGAGRTRPAEPKPAPRDKGYWR